MYVGQNNTFSDGSVKGNIKKYSIKTTIYEMLLETINTF